MSASVKIQIFLLAVVFQSTKSQEGTEMYALTYYVNNCFYEAKVPNNI